MTNGATEAFDLEVLHPDKNVSYLPKPIPTARDRQIGELLSSSISGQRIARLKRCIDEGHALVLRAFAERMASTAVRTNSPTDLRLGLIALLLALEGPDSRDALTIFPLFYDAVLRLQLNLSEFIESVRELVGDRMTEPFVQFTQRSDKSLQAMGYSEGTDNDGFRYVRNW